LTAFGCIYSNYPFNTEKNIRMHTSPPTNQPTNQSHHPSPLLFPFPSPTSFFFFYSIHSFIHCLSLSTTYLPHFSPPPPTHLISLHLSYFSRTHLISPSHTHTHLQFLPHTHPSLLSTTFPFPFSLFTFWDKNERMRARPENISDSTTFFFGLGGGMEDLGFF